MAKEFGWFTTALRQAAEASDPAESLRILGRAGITVGPVAKAGLMCEAVNTRSYDLGLELAESLLAEVNPTRSEDFESTSAALHIGERLRRPDPNASNEQIAACARVAIGQAVDGLFVTGSTNLTGAELEHEKRRAVGKMVQHGGGTRDPELAATLVHLMQAQVQDDTWWGWTPTESRSIAETLVYLVREADGERSEVVDALATLLHEDEDPRIAYSVALVIRDMSTLPRSQPLAILVENQALPDKTSAIHYPPRPELIPTAIGLWQRARLDLLATGERTETADAHLDALNQAAGNHGVSRHGLTGAGEGITR